jgi:plasmid stabilization system protein ParE
VKIVWLPSALDDLQRLDDFIRQRPEAGLSGAGELIRSAAQSLATFPTRCRPIPGRSDYRELFIEAYSQIYVLQFRVAGQNAVIVRVWHSRESR